VYLSALWNSCTEANAHHRTAYIFSTITYFFTSFCTPLHVSHNHIQNKYKFPMHRADYVEHSHWHCPMVHNVHIKNRQINYNIFSMLNTMPWCIGITKVKLHIILTKTQRRKDGDEWSDSSLTYFNHHHSMNSWVEGERAPVSMCW
jgi:hypothetical protein